MMTELQHTIQVWSEQLAGLEQEYERLGEKIKENAEATRRYQMVQGSVELQFRALKRLIQVYQHPDLEAQFFGQGEDDGR